MNEEEFFKEVSDIVVHTGSLAELNQVVAIKEYGVFPVRDMYRSFPLPRSFQFLRGIFIPPKEAVRETLEVIASGQDIDKLYDERWKKIYGDPRLQALDLRIQAKKLEADALFRVTFEAMSEFKSHNCSVSLGIYTANPAVKYQ